jgi:hypothetical protein
MAWRNLRADISEEFGGHYEHELNTEFVKQLWANRRERLRQRWRDYRELRRFRMKVDPAFRETIRAKWRAWARRGYLADPDGWRARSRAYYWRHREECRARARAYRAAHLEAQRARDRAYYWANAEEKRAKALARHHAKPKRPRVSGCGHAAPHPTGPVPRFCSDACRRRARLFLVPPPLERESALYALLEELRRV